VRRGLAGAPRKGRPDGEPEGALRRLHHRHEERHAAEATGDPGEVAARATALLERTDAARRPVRLLGGSLHNLADTDQAAPTRSAGAVETWLPFPPA